MKQELRQELRQKPILTLRLRQELKLLQQTILELREEINQQLEQNPTLEEVQEGQEEVETVEIEVDEERDNKDSTLDWGDGEGIDWGVYLENCASEPMVYFPKEKKSPDEVPLYENIIPNKVSLRDHLLWQLNLSNFSENEKEIAGLIIENIDSDGYLRVELDEISRKTGFPLQLVEATLKKVQEFDPTGVGARSIKECLLIQVRDIPGDHRVVEEIIENYLPLVEVKNYEQIVARSGFSMKEVIDAVKIITTLEPKPGRASSNEEPQYVIPDIIVKKVGTDYVIQLNEDEIPKIRISPYYRRIIGKFCEERGIRLKKWEEILEGDGGDISEGDGSNYSYSDLRYIRKKMREAEWFKRCLDNRKKTLLKVMKCILDHQRDYFMYGASHLKPLILKDIADDLGMHQSTISRVTSNKYVQTPHGVLPMKYFFNVGVKTGGEEVGSTKIKNMIKEFVSKEDHENPYSDKDIVEYLSTHGIYLARRTVVKYRQELGILSAKRRRKILK